VKTILFVDDHEVLARLSCDILEMNGYRAVSAFSGEDALAKFDQEEFDLVVTDFRMDGMTGLELAHNIQKKKPGMPIIIVTGYGKLDGADEFKVLGKEELFPNLLDQIKAFLPNADSDPGKLLQAV
jgi:DNA-binding NtrC family response regulator